MVTYVMGPPFHLLLSSYPTTDQRLIKNCAKLIILYVAAQATAKAEARMSVRERGTKWS